MQPGTALVSTTPPPRAGRREWLGLAVIALPCLLYSMDLTVLHLAVPAISAQLRPSSAELLWIIDIYGFLVAGALIPMGTLGDRIGRRRLLFIGAAAFAIASVLAAYSTSAEMLIATRALLGLAGATVAPSTLSLIRNMFPDPRQRTTAISIWITSYSLGSAIGPIVGGLLLEFFWWGSVFLIGVPVMALLLLVGPVLLPEYRDANAGRPDVVSAALSLGAVLGVTFGLKHIAQDGLQPSSLVVMAGGGVLGWLFVRRQLELADPLIDLRLFRLPAFTASLATYGLSIFVLFGGFLFLPQYLQLVLGLSPSVAGLWTLPFALAFVVASLLTPPLARRVRPATLMASGLVLAAAGSAVLMRTAPSSGVAPFTLGSVLLSLGIGPVVTLTTDLIVGSAPPERAGAASAISETSSELGGAVGIAVFGSVGAALYRTGVADVTVLNALGDAARDARSTLGGAVALAATLPTTEASELVSAARAAFVRSLHGCAALSAVGALALAIFAALKLRRAETDTNALPVEPSP